MVCWPGLMARFEWYAKGYLGPSALAAANREALKLWVREEGVIPPATSPHERETPEINRRYGENILSRDLALTGPPLLVSGCMERFEWQRGSGLGGRGTV